MGSVLSKIQHSNIDSIIKLWHKSSYFRVAIAMITFLIARRIYNQCHRIYYNLPLNGPSGLPLIGCIPYLLLNTYSFMQRMSKYGDIATYNLGLTNVLLINNCQIAKKLSQQNQLHHPHNNNDNKWSQRRQYVQQIVTQELNSKFITKCIKSYIEEQCELDQTANICNENGSEQVYLRKHLKKIIFNTLMIACFGITIDSNDINDEFYIKWDEITNKVRDSALNEPLLRAVCGESIYSIISKLCGRKNATYMELWEDIFGQYMEDNIKTNEDILNNTESIYYKLRHRQQNIDNLDNDDDDDDDTIICDLFVIMANAMDTTSASLEWCIMSLCKYPTIQHQVYEEIYKSCNGNLDNINLDLSYIEHLSVLKAFIYDNLRLYPLGSFPKFETNSTGKPIKIPLANGKIYSIPPDGLYHINMYGMTRMHANWDQNNKRDLDAINLDLWLDENNNFVINDAISGFGFGKNNCIGKAFAVKALQLILSLLIFKYTFSFKSKDEEMDKIAIIINKRYNNNGQHIEIIKEEITMNNTMTLQEMQYQVKSENHEQSQPIPCYQTYHESSGEIEIPQFKIPTDTKTPIQINIIHPPKKDEEYEEEMHEISTPIKPTKAHNKTKAIAQSPKHRKSQTIKPLPTAMKLDINLTHNIHKIEEMYEVSPPQKPAKAPKETKVCAESTENKQKQEKIKAVPLPIAMKLDINLTDDKRKKETVCNIPDVLDIAYNRAFTIDQTPTTSNPFASISIPPSPFQSNPFASNPFGDKKKSKQAAKKKREEPPPDPTTNDKNDDDKEDIIHRESPRVIRSLADSDKNIERQSFCKYYGSAKGCRKYKRCQWSHANPNSVTLCRWYHSKYGCKFGDRCKDRHRHFAPYIPPKHKLRRLPRNTMKRQLFSDVMKDATNTPKKLVGLKRKTKLESPGKPDHEKFHDLPEIDIVSVVEIEDNPEETMNDKFVFNKEAKEFIPTPPRPGKKTKSPPKTHLNDENKEESDSEKDSISPCTPSPKFKNGGLSVSFSFNTDAPEFIPSPPAAPKKRKRSKIRKNAQTKSKEHPINAPNAPRIDRNAAVTDIGTSLFSEAQVFLNEHEKLQKFHALPEIQMVGNITTPPRNIKDNNDLNGIHMTTPKLTDDLSHKTMPSIVEEDGAEIEPMDEIEHQEQQKDVGKLTACDLLLLWHDDDDDSEVHEIDIVETAVNLTEPIEAERENEIINIFLDEPEEEHSIVIMEKSEKYDEQNDRKNNKDQNKKDVDEDYKYKTPIRTELNKNKIVNIFLDEHGEEHPIVIMQESEVYDEQNETQKKEEQIEKDNDEEIDDKYKTPKRSKLNKNAAEFIPFSSFQTPKCHLKHPAFTPKRYVLSDEIIKAQHPNSQRFHGSMLRNDSDDEEREFEDMNGSPERMEFNCSPDPPARNREDYIIRHYVEEKDIPTIQPMTSLPVINNKFIEYFESDRPDKVWKKKDSPFATNSNTPNRNTPNRNTPKKPTTPIKYQLSELSATSHLQTIDTTPEHKNYQFQQNKMVYLNMDEGTTSNDEVIGTDQNIITDSNTSSGNDHDDDEQCINHRVIKDEETVSDDIMQIGNEQHENDGNHHHHDENKQILMDIQRKAVLDIKRKIDKHKKKLAEIEKLEMAQKNGEILSVNQLMKMNRKIKVSENLNELEGELERVEILMKEGQIIFNKTMHDPENESKVFGSCDVETVNKEWNSILYKTPPRKPQIL